MQYLVHWKGYTVADRTWIPAKELTHAKDLVEQFEAMQKAAQKSKEGIQTLQEQGKPKEGILLWTKSMPSRNPVQTPTSPTITAPKPSYSQVAIQHPPEPATKPGQRPATKENLRPCDPGKSPQLGCLGRRRDTLKKETAPIVWYPLDSCQTFVLRKIKRSWN